MYLSNSTTNSSIDSKSLRYNNSDFNMTVTVNGKTQNLRLGTNIMESMEFVQGENVIVFNGNGVVSIENTGGRL